MSNNEELLRYYWEELTFLRKMGQVYARRYPKVASRLELESGESPDPHVERLIESFAFLTGRIQHDLDSDFPEIAAELLNLLYPQLLLPIPSLAIAQFQVDLEAQLTTPGRVPKGTQLFAATTEGRVCYFRTCYPVDLWALEVVDATFEPPERYDFLDREVDTLSVLRLRIQSPKIPLADLELERLRFYINADPILSGTLYELIFNNTLKVVVCPDGGHHPTFLGLRRTDQGPRPYNPIEPVGFRVDDEVLPYPPSAQPAFRLLQEYFVLPESYQFFDVIGLDTPDLFGEEGALAFELLLLLDRHGERRTGIGSSTFSLGCTPIANLFAKTTEPIRVDHRTLYYPLVPDRRHEKSTEIHSILSVSGTSDAGNRSRDYAPFYSYTHAMGERRQRAFWHARRRPASHADLEGTEIDLAFYDLDWRPSQPPDEVIFAHTLCTNRRLAQQVAAGDPLFCDEAIPCQRIVSLTRPTRQISPPRDGANLWRLVSHLSVNYLSLVEGPRSLKALREILELYSLPEVPSIEQQIHGVVGLEARKVVARKGAEAWRGWCRGDEITLTFEESLYVGSNAYLFASVLRHFFALYTSTNSFTQLVTKKSHLPTQEWKRWPPMVGEIEPL